MKLLQRIRDLMFGPRPDERSAKAERLDELTAEVEYVKDKVDRALTVRERERDRLAHTVRGTVRAVRR